MDFHPELPLSSYFWSILCTHKSEGEGEVRVETKGEQELGILCTSMEMGGLPALDEEKAQNCCERYIPSFGLMSIWVSSCFLFLHFHFTSHTSVFVSHF